MCCLKNLKIGSMKNGNSSLDMVPLWRSLDIGYQCQGYDMVNKKVPLEPKKKKVGHKLHQHVVGEKGK